MLRTAGFDAARPRVPSVPVIFAFSMLLACAIVLCAAPSALAASPVAAAEGVLGGKWVQKNSCMYHTNESGSYVKGLAEIDGKIYYFDSKGIQRVGWRKVGGAYCFFTIDNGAAGSLVRSKGVNGIKLKKNGSAWVNATAKKELDLMVAAQKRCDKQTKPLDSVSTKERKLFLWIWKDCRERSSHKWHNYSGWHRSFAWDILKTSSGSCDSMGCAYAYLANAAGGKNVKIAASGGHTWTVVDGLVCDAEQAKQGFGWRMYRGHWYGNAGYYQVRISPRTKVWSKAKELKSEKVSSGKTGWAKKNGKRFYYMDGKKLKNRWFVKDGNKYFFLPKTGAAATASAKVKVSNSSSKKAYFVFDETGALQLGKKTRNIEVAGATYRVTKKGKAVSGWDAAHTKLCKADGELLCGVRWCKNKLWIFGDKGVYKKGKTKKARAAYVEGEQAAALLELLGTPVKRKTAASCRPGFEDGGEEITYTYEHIKFYTYRTADGPELVNYVESIS